LHEKELYGGLAASQGYL